MRSRGKFGLGGGFSLVDVVLTVAMAFAHRDGALAFLDPSGHDATGLGASLEHWMMGPRSPGEDDTAHTRWKDAFDRQRAVAIAQRELERKRANLQALEELEARQRVADDLRRSQQHSEDLAEREREVLRREEALRESGQSVVQREAAMGRLEERLHKVEAELVESNEARDQHAKSLQDQTRRVEVLGTELASTTAALRESQARATELADAERALAKQLLERDGQLLEQRAATQAAETESARRGEALASSQSQAAALMVDLAVTHRSASK